MRQRAFENSEELWATLSKLLSGKSCCLVASERGSSEWRSHTPAELARMPVAESHFGERFEVFVAFGGGAVIDKAKELVHRIVSNDKEPRRKYLPHIIAIPTIAGSGAEATHFASIWSGKSKESIEDKRLKPRAISIHPAGATLRG